MASPLVFALPGNELIAERLLAPLAGEAGALETRSFPDGETYLRFRTDPKGRSAVIVCSLDRPDEKFLQLAFAAAAARDLGAMTVGLVAPYLSYMRQDRRFTPGEAVTSTTFARLLSSGLDWLVTVDPHLHRYNGLGDIYPIPTRAARAAPLISQWIGSNVNRPVLLGPDIESEQWVGEVAGAAGAPYRVLQKSRRGDRDVVIEVPDLSAFREHTPVLVDDIVASGSTMIAAVARLREQRLKPSVCVAVHALFSDRNYDELKAQAAAVVSTNSVPHPSNAIDLSPVIAGAVRELMLQR
jgi:ribose-phosphate pyrophosphokinase